MIYITGDTHGDSDFRKLRKFAESNPQLTRDDYVIICGDFGAVWDSWTLRMELFPYTQLPFTVLFVDGNHENFDLLATYRVEMWNGGFVHKIKPNIIHLTRGQVFQLEGKTIFTFGGATSSDKSDRVEGESWWPQEMPCQEELEEGLANLKRYNNKVDYIVTHSCCERALSFPPLSTRTFQTDLYPENFMLSRFDETVDYKHWYFGHYHLDGRLNDKMTVLYQKILPIGE